MVKRALLLAARCASHCGTLMGLRVVVTESLPSSSMSLIDASGMITASTPLTFRVPEEASIELATASSWAGPWKSGKRYREGQFTQKDGGLWIASLTPKVPRLADRLIGNCW